MYDVALCVPEDDVVVVEGDVVDDVPAGCDVFFGAEVVATFDVTEPSVPVAEAAGSV